SSGARSAIVRGRAAARRGSISIAVTSAPVSSRASVSEPSPGPISSTWSPGPTPDARAMRRTVPASTTKFCPHFLVGIAPRLAARLRMSVGPRRRATSVPALRREVRPRAARGAVAAGDVRQAPADLRVGVGGPVGAERGHLVAGKRLRDAIGAGGAVVRGVTPAGLARPQVVQAQPLVAAPAVQLARKALAELAVAALLRRRRLGDDQRAHGDDLVLGSLEDDGDAGLALHLDAVDDRHRVVDELDAGDAG